MTRVPQATFGRDASVDEGENVIGSSKSMTSEGFRTILLDSRLMIRCGCDAKAS
jgi:hypothetical protein